MPKVFEQDGFRFFFYSDEHQPIHIHVDYSGAEARIELTTLKVSNSTLKAKDLKKALVLTKEYRTRIEQVWDEYFSKNN